MTADHRNM